MQTNKVHAMKYPLQNGYKNSLSCKKVGEIYRTVF
jgi:hypothetical protein